MDAYSSQVCQLDADDTFGPAVTSCARTFDFTLFFEQAILSLVPSTIFLLISPLRIWRLRISSQKTMSSWMSIAKPITALALVSVRILLLVYYTIQNTIRTSFSIPTAILDLLAAVTIIPLSYLEQHRSVKPSTLINFYLTLSAVLDLPQARTLYLIPGQLRIAIIFSVALAVRIALLFLEAWDKRAFLMEKYQTLATETTSGIFSYSLFLWMNSLFRRGYSKVILFNDLGPIDSSLGTAGLHRRLQDSWQPQYCEARMPLLRSLWKALRWSILSPVLPRLCYSGFLFAQPFLIDRATSYLSQPSNPLEDDIGYGLIGATACTYLGIAISHALFQHLLYRHITMVRGSLVSMIYTNSLSIEDRIDDSSAAVTLMSNDVDRICQSLIMLHDLWSRPLELLVGIILLALQIGWVSTIPLAVIFISAMLDSRVTLLIGSKVKVWSDAVQQRVSFTADVLSSMKSVKMLGLARPLGSLLQKERLNELKLQAKFRWSTVWLNTLGNLPPAVAPAATFVVYAIKARVTSSSPLNTSQIFTSLALINLITTPASELLTSFPSAAACLGCVGRIQEHLRSPTRHNLRALNTTGEIHQEKINTEYNLDMSPLRLTRVCLPINDSSNYLLRDLDLEFRQSSFTMILGPSGSGKSTLLRAILSEAKYSGTISINTHQIAYCPQVPWLFTGTIQQNVCGLEVGAVDETWYKSVLHACALDSVLLGLSQNDKTHIEGQSSSLSGGEKQRLGLARALYQRPRLILLDDVLSALDIKTEIRIMTRLFGKDGLLLKLGAAVVFVTHSTRWEPIADNVITLDGSGNAKTYCKAPHHDSLESEDLSLHSRLIPLADLSSSGNPATNCVFDELHRDDNLHVAPPRHGSDSRDYMYYFKSAILNWWTADHGSNERIWLPLYLTLAIGNGVIYGCTAWIMFLKLVPESAANLHIILLDVVMNAPYSFFARTDIGTILNRFTQDMTLVESQLPTGILCTLIYLLWTIGSLCLISLGSTWMALTIPAVFITLWCVQRIYLRTSRRLRAIELELRSPIYSHFLQTLNGLSSIRVFRWQGQFTNSMIDKVDRSQVPYYLLYCAQRWLQLVLDLIVAALAVVVVTLAVKLRSSTTPGSLGLSLNNVLSFNETLTLLLQYWTQLEVSLGAISRIREFSDQTPLEPAPDSPAVLTDTWPEYGGIEICDLNARYTGANMALSNFTISIRPGEKIGLCGRSGSGKSSLLSILLRLLEPLNGSIIIDGVDLTCIDHKTIRERLLSIPQDSFLLQNTIRFNLDPQAEYNDTQMITALSKVSLWPVIEKRGGLDAKVTSNSLSQGQKQLLSLARAIIGKEKRKINSKGQVLGGILLLDEATSNIDTTTDSIIQRVIRDEFSVYTILVVAHRLDTILDSDRIAVLDSGKVVEFDSPETLLSKDSAFSALYNARNMKEL
ncbi:hypothetical protein ACHAO8_010900 [Botrytis cinerea]